MCERESVEETDLFLTTLPVVSEPQENEESEISFYFMFFTNCFK